MQVDVGAPACAQCYEESCHNVQVPGLQPDGEAPPPVHLTQGVSQVHDSPCRHKNLVV